MLGSILVWLFLPFYSTSSVRSALFKSSYKNMYWILIGVFFILGWIGGKPVEYEYKLEFSNWIYSGNNDFV